MGCIQSKKKKQKKKQEKDNISVVLSRSSPRTVRARAGTSAGEQEMEMVLMDVDENDFVDAELLFQNICDEPAEAVSEQNHASVIICKSHEPKENNNQMKKSNVADTNMDEKKYDDEKNNNVSNIILVKPYEENKENHVNTVHIRNRPKAAFGSHRRHVTHEPGFLPDVETPNHCRYSQAVPSKRAQIQQQQQKCLLAWMERQFFKENTP